MRDEDQGVDIIAELRAWAHSHAALLGGHGNVDDVDGFIAWVSHAVSHATANGADSSGLERPS
jgi:hypothetical protein